MASSKEYLDYEMSVKVVDSLEEAIDHINRYGTRHSESIVTESYAASERLSSLKAGRPAGMNTTTLSPRSE